jgi:predicted RNA-binding protein
MQYIIIMTAREMYSVDADTEEEAYDLIATGVVEAKTKVYFGDDIVVEGDGVDSDYVKVNGKQVKLHESIREKINGTH